MTSANRTLVDCLLLFSASCCGAAIGALIVCTNLELIDTTLTEPFPIVEKRLSIIANNVKDLTNGVDRLEAAMQNLSIRKETIPPDAGGLSETIREVVEETIREIVEDEHPLEESKNDDPKSKAHWVSVLDPDLARVLVERGLTPFDPNVAKYTREAADSLRAIEIKYKAATSTFLNSFRSRRISATEYQEACRPHKNASQAARLAVLEKLRFALDELCDKE